MNIALFAADVVGRDIAEFFGSGNRRLSCLVLDSKDRGGLNSSIIKALGIKKYAKDRIFYSDNLSDKKTLKSLKDAAPDMIVLAWWPYIIKPDVIKLAKSGCLNFHPSLLPYSRGKDSNFWSIVEDTPFGVSINFVSDGIDNGDIAFQSKIDKAWQDTGKTLYEKAREEIVKLFKGSFKKIESGQVPRRPQDGKIATFHKRSELDPASKIELDRQYTARKLLNIIRARTFEPYPAAWFIENGRKYEVRVDIREISYDK